MPWLKVGELANRTGLTVRALHHYDEIGLLTPSRRSETGYRLYGEADVERLLQIRSLQQMGWSLDKIRELLAHPDLLVLEMVEQHLDRLRQQLALQQALVDRLEKVAKHLRATGTAAVDDFLQTIEVLTMYEKYYSPEQRLWLEERAQEVGQERIQEVEHEWRDVFAGFQIEMEKGTDPTAEPAQALARKAQSLIQEFTGGRPDISHSLGNLYREEGATNVLGRHGVAMAPGVGDYMSRAMAVLAAARTNEDTEI